MTLLQRWAGLDPRGLAAFRVALGFVLLADLASRWSVIPLYYTDTGVLSAHYALSSMPQTLQISYLFGLSTIQMARGFFVFAAGVYMALTLGFATRIAHVLSILAFVSLTHRNYLIVHGGDTLVLCWLIWSLFVPLDRVASLDRLWGLQTRAPRVVVSPASIGWVVQAGLIVFLFGSNKVGRAWAEGDALHHLLWLDSMVRGAAVTLRSNLSPGAMYMLTKGWPWVEVVTALLLWSPLAIVRVRPIAAVLLLGQALMLGLVFNLGTLPMALALPVLPLLGAGLWSRVWPVPLASESNDESLLADRISGWVAQSLATSFAATMFVCAVHNNPSTFGDRGPAPAWTRLWTAPTKIHQAWSLFAPDVPSRDGRIIIRAQDHTGTVVDPRTWADPQGLSPALGSQRTIFDHAFELRMRAGFAPTMRSELERFVWNSHLRGQRRRPRLRFEVVELSRGNPPVGERQPAPIRERMLIKSTRPPKRAQPDQP